MKSLKNWFSKKKKGGIIPALSAEAKARSDWLEEMESHFGSMGKVSGVGAIETPEIGAVIKPFGSIINTTDSTVIKPYTTINLPASSKDWCIISKEGDEWAVSNEHGTYNTTDFFAAMIWVSQYYGVEMDETIGP